MEGDARRGEAATKMKADSHADGMVPARSRAAARSMHAETRSPRWRAREASSGGGSSSGRSSRKKPTSVGAGATASGEEEPHAAQRQLHASQASKHEKTASAAAGDIVRSSAAGASFLMAAVAAQRVLTFVLNAALVRFVTPEVLGFASSDMELLLATILFLSREACRVVALRTPTNVLVGDDARVRQQFINLAWLPVPVALTLSAIALAWQSVIKQSSTDTTAHADWVGFRHGFMVYVLAAVIEALAEPFYIIATALLAFGARTSIETGATLLRCVITFGLVAGAQLGPVGFAFGQLGYALTLLIGYSAYAAAQTHRVRGWRALLPRKLSAASQAANNRGNWQAFADTQFGSKQRQLLTAFAAQSAVKHLLTEGDRLVLTAFADRSTRGVYAVVTNYGSLPARIIFQPIEESLRAMVSKLVPSAPSGVATSSETLEAKSPSELVPSSARNRRGRNASSTSNRPASDKRALDPAVVSAVDVALQVYSGVLRLVLTIGLGALALGHSYTDIVVRMALGSSWAQAGVPAALSAYLIYLCAMAANGVTEAFATAAADAGRVSSANRQLLLAFVAYAGLAAILLPAIGPRGLVYASCVNMLVRAVGSGIYVKATARRYGLTMRWHHAVPSAFALAALLACAVTTAAAYQLAYLPALSPAGGTAATLLMSPGCLLHLAGGIASALLLAGVLYVRDLPALKETWDLIRGKRSTKAE